jgi:acetoin utilization protein AcuB
MNTAEWMTRHPECIDANESLHTAIQKLLELDVRHLPVVDDGELVGMLSDRDINGCLGQALGDSTKYAAMLDEPVSKIMSADVISASPETELGDVIDLLLENKIGAVPVVEDHLGKLVGIISYVDVLRALRDTA